MSTDPRKPTQPPRQAPDVTKSTPVTARGIANVGPPPNGVGNYPGTRVTAFGKGESLPPPPDARRPQKENVP